MIVVMKAHASEAEIQTVVKMVEDLDYNAHVIRGIERTVVACVGDERGEKHQLTHLESVAGVERVMPVVRSFKLASREVRPEGSRIKVGNAEIGGKRIAVIAGPCAVESVEQVEAAADAVKMAGAHMLRGGAFKPRTSPYAFQGLEGEGLKMLEHAGRRVGLPVVTEIMDPHDIDLVIEHSDMLQVGARNAQNFSLLRRLGRTKKPVLLKRGMSTKLEEFVMAAEYILSEGNPNVVLCERGIRTFETATRNTLDLNAVPLLKEWTHLPVLVDPSHGTGMYKLVAPMALAAIAAGADGLLIEVHPRPEHALSDGPQQLKPSRFADLMKALKPLAEAVGRTL
jgi:3-deoxy-7-phosphoheptulonate synthase